MAKPTKRPAPPVTRRPKDAVPARPRTALERFSAPLLLRLHGMPRWLFPFVTGVLLVVGLMVANPVIAAVFLSLLLLMLLWLIALSWPLLTPIARLMRGAVLLSLLLVIVARAQGRM